MTRISCHSNPFNFSENSQEESSAQLAQDSLQFSFSEQASDPLTLLAMTACGLAYRLGKVGVYTVGAIHELPLLSKVLASSIGLGLEVSAFRGVNHAFRPSEEAYWSTHGFVREYVNFGCLKGVGHYLQSSNGLLRHFSQNLGMMAGEEATAYLNLTSASHRSFAERFAHASATNLALGVGHYMSKFLAGSRVQVFERSLDQSFYCQRELIIQKNERVFSMSSDRIFLEPSDGRDGPLKDRFSLAVTEAIHAYLAERATPQHLAVMQLHEMGRALLAATNELQDRGENEVRLEDMLLIRRNPFLKIPESDSATPELLESFQGWSGFERLRGFSENSQLPNSMRCAAITALAFSNHEDVKEVLNRILNENEGIVAHAPLMTQRKWTAKAALQAFERRQIAPFVRQRSKPYRTI